MTEKFRHWLPQLLGVHAITIGQTVYYQARNAGCRSPLEVLNGK